MHNALHREISLCTKNPTKERILFLGLSRECEQKTKLAQFTCITFAQFFIPSH